MTIDIEAKMYAVIDNGVVLNCIIAYDLETAELVSGHSCVEFTLDSPAHIGLKYENETFEQPPSEETESYLYSGIEVVGDPYK
jgi:hypothetical protein